MRCRSATTSWQQNLNFLPLPQGQGAYGLTAIGGTFERKRREALLLGTTGHTQSGGRSCGNENTKNAVTRWILNEN
jgi:hypothetical protein